MKISDTLLQQDGLSMAHDGVTYCGTRGEYTFLILMGRNELVASVLRGGEEPDKDIFRDFVKARPEFSGCKSAGTRVIFPPPRRCGEKLCREDPHAPAGASLVPA